LVQFLLLRQNNFLSSFAGILHSSLKYSQICFDVPEDSTQCLGTMMVLLSDSLAYLPCFDPSLLINPYRISNAISFFVLIAR